MKSKNLIKKSKSVPSRGKTDAILESYLVCAQREGVEHVTLQKVADEAGLAYGTVHYHFGKDERGLLGAALEYVGAASARYMDEELAPAGLGGKADGVKAYVDAKFAWSQKFPTYASMLCYFIYQSSRDKAAAALTERLQSDQAATIATLVLQEIGKGRYPMRADVRETAERIQLTLGGGQLAALGQTAARQAHWKKLTWEMIASLLAGTPPIVS